MPTYEYECNNCSHSFEAFQSMKDEPLSICPQCGGAVRRVVSGGAGIIYKGQGFYSTDKGSQKPAAKTSKEPAPCGAGASKPACASCPAAQSDS